MANNSFFVSPRVTVSRRDSSFFANGLNFNTAALVAPFFKGPLEPTLITSVEQLRQQYLVGDTPSLNWGFGFHSAAAFLNRGGKGLYIKRVVKTSASHSGAAVFNSEFSNPQGGNITTGFVPYKYGSFQDYLTGQRQLIRLGFSAALVTLNVVDITLNDGTTPKSVQVTFTTDSNTTMLALADAINNAINYSASGTVAKGFAYARATTGTSLNEIILIAPEGITLSVTTSTVTLGASQAIITVAQSATNQVKLFDVFAANPGLWGSDVGIKIDNVLNGSHQQATITFSGSLAATHTFATSITYKNRSTPIEVTYATSHAATMAAIASAFQTALGGYAGLAYVSSTNVITILAPETGPNKFSLNAITMGGTTPPTATVANTAGVAGNNTFQIGVYTRANANLALETFVVSLERDKLDNFGRSQYIEDVINDASNGSRYIRINHNEANVIGQVKANVGTSVMWLSGGDDGLQPSSADIAAAYDVMKDRRKYDVRLLINGGYTDTTVQAKMIEVAEDRKDCIAIIDVPSNSQTAQAAAAWKNTTLNSGSTYAMAVGPDIKVLDVFSNKTMLVPPSGYVAALCAETFSDRYWKSPAGLNRGRIFEALGARFEYNDAELDALAAAQINPIAVMARGAGFCLIDELTLQTNPSALSFVHIRMIMIKIETAISDVLPVYLQEPLNVSTLFAIEQLGERELSAAKAEGAIKNYLWKCDEDNNPPDNEDRGHIDILMRIDPVRAVRSINLESEVTRAGAVHSESVV